MLVHVTLMRVFCSIVVIIGQWVSGPFSMFFDSTVYSYEL
ncbi:putative membrane protein [Ehrlichia cf. muris str. EmCRT]|uniref:Putative membrane protein n=1 Tax=Ehrlichia cf. muris str. EmCRT TaxID=1359167 RepID=A0A0F3NG95_9RICK|nr:putative membrane protein [Ehrlichia cf. muris str. EmCRT]